MGTGGRKSRKQETGSRPKDQISSRTKKTDEQFGIFEVNFKGAEVQLSYGVCLLIPSCIYSQPQAKRESGLKDSYLKKKECTYKKIKHTRAH